MTPSAFSIHSRVSGFIEHFAPLHDLLEEEVVPLEALVHLLWSPHDEVDGNSRPHLAYDFESLRDAGAAVLHDHEQVDIRVLGRRPVGVRAEQDHLLGSELRSDALREGIDLCSGHAHTSSYHVSDAGTLQEEIETDGGIRRR